MNGGARTILRTLVMLYLFFLVGWPVWMVVQETFFSGENHLVSTLRDPAVRSALRVTLSAAAWAVVLNTVFGITLGILLVRHQFHGKRLLGLLVDLPIAVSPIVVGLALLLAYGPVQGWIGRPLAELGVRLVFSFPGIVLAVTFVSLPLVLRAVIPVLREIGMDQEVAARSLGAQSGQILWRITLPSIRSAAIYGVILTLARAVGEFGAVLIISGGLVGQTETATMAVQRFHQGFATGSSYAIGFLLALIGIAALAIVTVSRPKEHTHGN